MHGRAVQVDPVRPILKVHKTKRMKLEINEQLSKLLSKSICAATAWMSRT